MRLRTVTAGPALAVFAAVTVLEALHHFFDYDQALGEIHRVLAPV